MSPKVSLLWMLLLQLLNAALGDVSHLEYTITPSSQVAYYHYPAPRQQPVLQQQQHQQQQRYQHAQQPQPQQQYQQLARQFAAPHLEHAAFTQALTSQGYVFGAPSAPLPATVQAAAQPQSQALKAAPLAAATGRAIAGGVASADANSLNLKLPVPFGLAPLNVAQLPLQAGAPYASVPHTTGLTSYGTPQIQRR